MKRNKETKRIKIAIDGPSGSGKSTLAKQLASALGYVYVDTGAIYRTVGLFARRENIDPHDEEALSARFDDIRIDLKWVDGVQHIFLDGDDVSEAIRTPEGSMYASAVSALPKVRAFLLDRQREIAREHDVVMDGRDIGTVIFPDADVKIFMSAAPEVRAGRRYKELLEKGQDVTLEDVLRDMTERDANDRGRDTAPCVPADDAVMFDNSDLDVEGTVKAALEIIREKLS